MPYSSGNTCLMEQNLIHAWKMVHINDYYVIYNHSRISITADSMLEDLI